MLRGWGYLVRILRKERTVNKISVSIVGKYQNTLEIIMPINAHIFRIFVASSGDLKQEREIIKNLVQEWNYIFGYRNQMYLEPVLFESHIWYDSNQKAQELINSELVDSCDMMIALFWKRIGTKTENAIGGTVEEIEKFSRDGKPTILCFKNSEMTREDFEEYGEDISHISKIRKQYKSKLTLDFSSSQELKETLYKQIAHFSDKFREEINHKKGASMKKRNESVNSHYQPSSDSERLGLQAIVNREADNRILKKKIFEIYKRNNRKLRILDFGCGNGIVGHDRFSSKKYIEEVVGIDIRQESIDLAQNIQNRSSHFKYVVGDIQKIQQDIGKFDLVYVAQVLHHVADPLSILKCLWECLYPGGGIFARNSDDLLDITYPETRDMDYIMEVSPRIKGTSDRFYGRKLYGDLCMLKPKPVSVTVDFNVLNTANKDQNGREEYFRENHGWRINYAKKLSNESNGKGADFLLYNDLDLAMKREFERYRRDDSLFALAVQIIAYAEKPYE